MVKSAAWFSTDGNPQGDARMGGDDEIATADDDKAITCQTITIERI